MFFPCKDDSVEAICPEGEVLKLKFQPQFIPFFEICDWLVGVKFQRLFKVTKMCAPQICNMHLRKNENITFTIDSVRSLFLITGMYNYLCTIENFLSLCSSCETLKNIEFAWLNTEKLLVILS